jgi:sugar phosphate isomerase/epimerase
MSKEIFAHVPYPMLGESLEYATGLHLNPEVFFSADSLDRLIPEELAALAANIRERGMQSTIHAPFMDLNPGSAEPLLREATRHRFRQVLDAAEILRPRVIVFHPGYDRWRYGEQKEAWLGHSIEAWQTVLQRAEIIDCTVAVENIFEEEPSTLRTLFEALDSPRFRHCFDVGHWNLFHTVNLEEWFAQLGSYIAEIHIHDNRGTRDDHGPIGTGNIDFPLFFRLMQQYAPDAVHTIEAHSRPCLEQAIPRLRAFIG